MNHRFMAPLYIIFVLLVSIISGVFFLRTLWTIRPVSQSVWTDTDSAHITIKDTTITAEVCASISKRQKGLSGHTPLTDTTGMLFIFAQPQKEMFWMKDMTFPIDIIWISNNVVVDVTKNLPIPTSTLAIPTASPSTPASMVLEVSAGMIEKLGISVGDAVRIEKVSK